MKYQKTACSLRPTNIEKLGEVPWGTHCCLLYDAPAALCRILVNFFQAGLESNEYCLWLTSGVVSRQIAENALQQTDCSGRIEICSTINGCAHAESFDPQTAVNNWLRQANKAIEAGYKGFRLAGDPFMPSLMDRRIFLDYETLFDRAIKDYPIIALCIYPVQQCSPADIACLSSRHHYTLIAENGTLEISGNPDRKELAGAVKSSRELFHSLVDPNPDAMFIVDMNGRIQFANRAGENLFGKSHKQLKNQNFPFSYDCGKATEVELTTPEGASFTGELRAAETIWEQYRARIVTIGDISERKTAELILEKQQQELSAIYENSPNPMLLMDKNLQIRKANTAALRAAGRSRNEILGMQAGEALRCIHVLDSPSGGGFGKPCENCILRNTILDTLQSGRRHKQLPAELTLRQEGLKQHYHYRISTIPLQIDEWMVLVCFEDISALTNTLKSLRNSEARIRSVFQAAPVGIGTVVPRTENGEIVSRDICDANEHLCRILGYSEEEMRGLESRTLYESHEEYVRIGKELYSQVREHGMGKVDTRWVRKDGSVIDIHLSMAPFNSYDWSGGLSFTILDVTRLKEAEAEQKKLENQLRQSQKMEAIGQLTGGIAHDFNNLLQIINGYGDMIKEEIPADHTLRPSLDEILNAGSRAADLVLQLLAFSRQQVMKMEYLNINDLIHNLAKMIRRIIGEHIKFEFIRGRNLGLVRADAGQIEQVIINICINARDAMPEGGRLMIETSNVFINGEYCRTHLDTSPGRYVLLCISDNGTGMDQETQNRIFDPFFTTKETGQGTGLGLSTAYGIIAQHEGNINVYSEPGRGTLFKVYLPVVERRAAEVGREFPEKAEGGDETILVAEDDQMVRELMQTILERNGYTVYTAEDGVAAVELFTSLTEQIDLAIVDVVMPKQSGKAVYDRLRQIKPSLPVLFASGYSENAIHTNFILKQGLELLQKPFASGDLLNKIRDLLNRPE
ncbi:MAG: PAS domain S-box protein [Desulfosalsimonadaceae bacterium]